jgi:hypothetical protein
MHDDFSASQRSDFTSFIILLAALSLCGLLLFAGAGNAV